MLVRQLIKNYDKLGLWTSVFALGAFVGPTLAGILFDAVGFPLATVFILVAELAALVALFIGLLRTLRFVYISGIVRHDWMCLHQRRIPYEGQEEPLPSPRMMTTRKTA